MPLSKARERLMLRALNRYGTGPDGCAQAWLSLPHSMRVFYPHAYCSRSATWKIPTVYPVLTLDLHSSYQETHTSLICALIDISGGDCFSSLFIKKVRRIDCPSVCDCQSVERGRGSQAVYPGSQSQARRLGVDTRRAKQTGGHKLSSGRDVAF